MTAKEIIGIITEGIDVGEVTCDTFKSGDINQEVSRVAVSMFATVDIIRQAKAWRADMLIVHEPTYYEHYEKDTGSKIAEMKRKIVEDSGLVIFRYHDNPHSLSLEKDEITEGGIRGLGLKGTLQRLPYPATSKFILDEPLSARELKKMLEDRMGLSFVRVAGETDYKSRNLALCFGTPPGMEQIIERDDIDIVLVGETCEWGHAERVRDAVSMGIHKSLMVLTHEGSEREGMKLFTDRFSEKFPQIEVKYMECGEVYNKM